MNSILSSAVVSIARDTTSPDQLTICGRGNLHVSDDRNVSLEVEERQKVKHKRLIVIGHDKMNHVQLNNKLNAIFHATDYAYDNDADLAIIRQGWPNKALKTLFRGDHLSHATTEWEKQMTKNLNIHFLDKEEILQQSNAVKLYQDVDYQSADDMYYYHTKNDVSAIRQRRETMLRFIWSQPTRNQNDDKKDVCSVVNQLETSFDSTSKESSPSYTVIHSRWMKKNGCLNRMGGLVHYLKEKKGMSMDRSAPCLLEPSYIESIVRKCNMMDKPIYVISDGLNEGIIENLEEDARIGKLITRPPKTLSWVGGDMMLGVLSDCFIGTPISTMSGNIARARLAIGKDPSTNFLFPKKRQRSRDPWDFLCNQSADCLYDNLVLNHYVG